MSKLPDEAVYCNLTWQGGMGSPLDRARAGDFNAPAELLGRYRRADTASPWEREVKVEFDIDGKTPAEVIHLIAALPSLADGKFDISFNYDGYDDVYFQGWRIATEEEIRLVNRWLRREAFLAAEREKDRIAIFKADHPELFSHDGGAA